MSDKRSVKIELNDHELTFLLLLMDGEGYPELMEKLHEAKHNVEYPTLSEIVVTSIRSMDVGVLVYLVKNFKDIRTKLNTKQ
jgi:hypothetical protein